MRRMKKDYMNKSRLTFEIQADKEGGGGDGSSRRVCGNELRTRSAEAPSNL